MEKKKKLSETEASGAPGNDMTLEETMENAQETSSEAVESTETEAPENDAPAEEQAAEGSEEANPEASLDDITEEDEDLTNDAPGLDEDDLPIEETLEEEETFSEALAKSIPDTYCKSEAQRDAGVAEAKRVADITEDNELCLNCAIGHKCVFSLI